MTCTRYRAHLCREVDLVAEYHQPLVQAQRGHGLQEHASGGAHVLAVLLERLLMLRYMFSDACDTEAMNVSASPRQGSTTGLAQCL